MKNTLLILSIILSAIVSAQDSLSVTLSDTIIQQEKYNPLAPPNTYQNNDNPNYWKNKMPNKAYWQQDVYYNIKAHIDEEKDIITANEQLTYTNNSPDELNIVYFHLYQNAFQPDSYLDELQAQNKKNPKYGNYESQKLGTVIEKITVNGENVKTELDNTILKVYLPNTLKTNMSITFDIDFKTYFDKKIDINEIDANDIVNRTLNTNNNDLNKKLWLDGGYTQIPSVEDNILELANSDLTKAILK